MTNPGVSWRQRIGAHLRTTRLVAAVELLLVVLLQGMQTFGLVSAAVLYQFGLSWLSLWLRQSGWRSLGLSRPTHWPRTIALGVTAGLVYQLVSLGLVTPWLEQLTHQPLDLSQLAPLRASPGRLLIALVAALTLGAFVEEMVYRGYVLHRLVDLFGPTPAGWTIGVLGSAALFGWGHAYQGLTGMLETALFACVMAGIYLLARRQLWLPIIAHGVYDTLGFILIYLGWYP